MYAEKEQWLLFILCGIITVVGINIWAAKRDIKGIESLQESQVVYKQLPVIPFTN